MKRSLVKKFFFSFSVVALCSLVLLGSIIVAFTGNYCLKEKQTELRTSAIWISNKIASTGSVSYFQYKSLINFALNSTGGDIFITDINGNVLISSEETVREGTVVPHNFATEALKGEMTISSNMKGFFPQKRLIVSVPVVMPTGKTVAVVYNTSSYDEMIIIIKDITALFLWASILVVVFLLFAAYLMTNRLVRPIKEMAEASHCISKGDFSKVITVDRDDEIGELAMEFNHMIQSLAAGEQMNRSFVANVSHELKTPMTSIGGFIDGILDGTIPPEEEKKYLSLVSNEVKRLSRMVVSMLNLSKIEAGEISLNPTDYDVSKQIFETLLSFEKRIDEGRINIEGFENMGAVSVKADRDLLQQVIYNLIDNAVKFTPENGTISFFAENDREKTTVTIRNSGAGVSPEEISRIFERFYKVDKSRSYDTKGVGLGLYIVKTIINMHDGEIYADSKQGEYTEFRFIIPCDFS